VVRFVVFLVPIALSFLVAVVLSRSIDSPDPFWSRVGRWLFISFVATLAMIAAQRLMRRALPLAALFSLSLVFPDETPSRFGLALRGMSARQLERRMAEVDEHGLGDTPREAAASLLEMVAALSRHDRVTRGHSERVRAYAVMIGEEMELEPDEIDRLRWAGLLHDVGKLHVPDEILNKSGELTEEEFEVVKTHTTVGQAMVAPLADWLGDSASAVHQHHERYAGGGYPTGVPAEQLPLASRIVAVADAFDVMTAARSYKPPISAASARAELERCAGSQFDPEVVRAMLNISLGKLWRGMGPVSGLAQVGLFPRPVAQGGANVTVAAAALVSMLLTGIAAATGIGGGGSVVDPVVITSATTTTSISSTTTSVPADGPGDGGAAGGAEVGGGGAASLGAVPAPVSGSTTTTTTSTVPPTSTTESPTTTSSSTTTAPPSTTVAPPASTTTTTISSTTTAPSTSTTSDTTISPTTTSITTTVPPTPGVLVLASPGSGDRASQPLLDLEAERPAQNPVLPNYDTDRNPDPGLTLVASPAMLLTTDPLGAQTWLFPASSTTVDGTVSLDLWIAPEGPPGPGQFEVRAGIFDCDADRTSCTRLVFDTQAIASTAGVFVPANFDLTIGAPYVAAPGNRLELRVATHSGSSNDAWIGYDAVGMPAQLVITPPAPPPAPLAPAAPIVPTGPAPGAAPLAFVVLAALIGLGMLGRRPATAPAPAGG
jgi:HD-GYP domain-containing protein (c-di-GMP phosphodiesterase class II)